MPKPAPVRVIAKPVDPATLRRAVIFTIGRRRALMERLEHRRSDVAPPQMREVDPEPAD